MGPGDLGAVAAVAGAVHAEHPERDEVFAERLALDPEGCRILEAGDKVAGYIFSHPWRALSPPALDSLLGALPVRAETYYIHDIALMPEARGGGAARAILATLEARARALRLPDISLVTIADAAAFWFARGFTEATVAGPSAAALASYGPGAMFLTRRL